MFPDKLKKSDYLSLKILALAGFIVLTLFHWQGNQGLNLSDEGFLWYGAQRVMLGEVPIRDFMSYDPGRYYWSAALMGLWRDNGIMALRAAVAVFQAMGFFVGLLLIARTVGNQKVPYLFLSAITLVAWMYPRHKLFDISLSILLVAVLSFLVQNPKNRRYFFTGLSVGLIAVFGRNHGLYGAVGSLGVMVWLRIKQMEGPKLFPGIILWAAGVVVGFMPVILMALFIPGFAVAFLDSVTFFFKIRATNISLPIPWPWLVSFSSLPLGEAIRGVLIGLFFIATVIFGLLTISWVVRQKIHEKHVSPTLVAASFLDLPYAHFAFSRSDVSHLAQGAFPFLIGCLVLLAPQPAKIKWPLGLILCGASLWVMYIYHPGCQCHVGQLCAKVEISGSLLEVHPITANDISLIRKLADRYAPNGRSFMATPLWPGVYPLLDRKSPIWEIYAFAPRSPTFERMEIERIKNANPGFVIVLDIPLDGREELRFRNTHPLTHRYILDNFERLPEAPDPAYQIYRARDHTP